MKQITFKQYRSLDLTIFCVLTAVFETVASFATTQWFNLQAMAVSITLTMTCIVMVRWGAYAMLPSFIGAVAFCVVTNASAEQYVVYCLGSLFCMVALPLLKRLGKENTRNDFFKRTVFVIATYLSVVLGRWLCSLMFNFSFESLLPFITTDILSLLFALIVFSLAKNADGLVEDQKHYLLRLDEERRNEQQDSFNNF